VKQYSLDPVPTSLLKDCIDLLAPFITSINNTSLTNGCVPSVFKHAYVTIIQCYAPTSPYDEDDVEAFYEDTSKLMKKHRQDRLIIYGDFNAKVGAGNKSDVNGIYGIGRRNERGERLVEFCKENSLIISNTLFKQHPRRTFTWTSPDGQTRNQIDYMLIQNRWKTSLKNVKTRCRCGYRPHATMGENKVEITKTE